MSRPAGARERAGGWRSRPGPLLVAGAGVCAVLLLVLTPALAPPAGRALGSAVATSAAMAPVGPGLDLDLDLDIASGRDIAPGRDPAAGCDPAPSAKPSRVAKGMTLSVPALGLTTDVAEVDPVGGTIDPPTFDRAYRIAPYGTPGSDNTTYIAGHSWNAGDAVFNPLLDVASQQATLRPGDVVDVVEDGVHFSYEVLSTARYPKGTLADVDDVWQKVPGRLVLITCFQLDTGARSRDNLVVTAQLVPPHQP